MAFTPGTLGSGPQCAMSKQMGGGYQDAYEGGKFAIRSPIRTIPRRLRFDDDNASPIRCRDLGQKLARFHVVADIHLAPVMAYFSQTPEGKSTLAKSPNLARWWHGMSARPSMAKTQPKL